MAANLFVSLMLMACSGGIGGTPKDDVATDTGASAATLEIDLTSVDFGEVPFGDLAQETVNLTNNGGTALLVTSLTVGTPFSVSPTNMTLNAGTTSVITVYAQATTYDTFADVITIATADADIGTVELPVTATTDADADGDGYDTVAAGGDDCYDSTSDTFANPAHKEPVEVNPGATEEWYDGTDENCDGASDYDQDGDGYESDAYNTGADGGDCQDTSADFHPGADDVPYDNRDTNCDGANDWDADGDGYGSAEYEQGSDCDDNNAGINIDALETLDGKDNDCDGDTDKDALAEYAPYIYIASGTWDRVGYAAALGDLDDDGYAEILIGAPYSGSTSASGYGRGGLGVFQGGPTLLASGTKIENADNFIEGENTEDMLGSYVSVVGDYDGDGSNDVAITAGHYGAGGGAVYLLHGDDVVNHDLGDSIAKFTSSNGANNLGRGLGTSIDLNGDGMDELVAMYTNGPTNCFALEYGNTAPDDLPMANMDALYSTTGSEVAFYRNAPVGGDLDGDGYEDLLISDGSDDYSGGTDNGALFALWGSTTEYHLGGGIESTATTLMHGASNSSYYAWSSQLGDDWDGDGDAELWVCNSGTGLYVFEGGTDMRSGGLSTTDADVFYDWYTTSTDAEQIRRYGDVTGDGVDEMIVFNEDTSGSYGKSELFSSELQSGTYGEHTDRIGDLTGTSTHGNGNVGYGMPAIGADIDGDGDNDFVVGDPDATTEGGEAYVLINGYIEP